MTSLSTLNMLFKYRHFDSEIIILCVRWYVNYKLSYRDLVEMMAECGVNSEARCPSARGQPLDGPELGKGPHRAPD